MGKIIHYLLVLIPVCCLSMLSCSSQSGSEQTKTASDPKEISLHLLASFSNSQGASSSAEIVAYDAKSKKLFVVNSVGNRLDILDFKNASEITFLKSIELNGYGKGINSVAVKNGIVAAAMEHTVIDQEGSVVFFNTDGLYLNKVQAGILPDMLTFTPDGKKVLVANEGQPSDDYSVDPEGSISIIDLPADISKLSQKNVRHADFRSFNDSLKVLQSRGVRIFGPGASVAQDLEPEYIAVAEDSEKAWITLQENNAVAILDIASGKITDIKALGGRDFRAGEGNTSFGKVKTSCLLKGMHQPDGISAYTINGNTYLITANEGDPRNYEGFKEMLKLGNETYFMDREKFPNADELKDKKNFGKLHVSKSTGDADEDGDFDEIHCYGSRSFSIWDSSLKNIYDSGDDFEKIACKDEGYCRFNERFEKIEEGEKLDHRGPEPESVVIGHIGKQIYAFITLERYGGVMVYNVTNPSKAYFIDYSNSNLAGRSQESRPEGIIFIDAQQSPNGKNLIVVANEGTSTIDVYNVEW